MEKIIDNIKKREKNITNQKRLISYLNDKERELKTSIENARKSLQNMESKLAALRNTMDI